MKKYHAWILAILLTLSAMIYQRLTGPSYPKRVKLHINGQLISAKLPRSHQSGMDCRILIPVSDTITGAELLYRYFPGDNPWIKADFIKDGENLAATLPSQPPAGKLAYKIVMIQGNEKTSLTSEPVIIRFAGKVPAWILFPHIILMFIAMLASTLTGLLALFHLEGYRQWMWISFMLLTTGGLVFGPVLQYYAFGDFWTGFPFGYDLTDNKTLIAWLCWLAAIIINLKNNRPFWIIAASVMLIVVYSLPHSLWGSELNRETGVVITGK